MTKFFKGKIFGPPCTIDITFADADRRAQVEVAALPVAPSSTSSSSNSSGGSGSGDSGSEQVERMFLFSGSDTISGQVSIQPLPGKEVEHLGVRIELIGQIQVLYEKVERYEFTSLVKELGGSPGGGTIVGLVTYPFEFVNVEKPYESYNGINARLRYFLRVTISRQYATNIVKEIDFWVENPVTVTPEINNGIKMEVGIEDSLHIEFEYDKSKYHLNDVILGKIYFLLIKIPIKHMEIDILKRESSGVGQQMFNETETVTKYEIMDGIPESEECIPIRLFLKGYPITPTYSNVNSKFSVRYYLNLVLVDEEDRKYFKQQEITMWRKTPSVPPPRGGSGAVTSSPQ